MKEVRSVVFRSIMPIKEALRGVWSLAILRSNWRLLDDHNQTRRQRSLRMSLFRNGISRSCKEGNYHAASCIVQSHHRYKRKPKIQKWIYIYISTTRLTSIKNRVWICLAQMSQSPRSTFIPTKWHSFDCYTQLPIGKRIFVPHPNLSGIFITGKLITLPDRWRSIIFTAIVWVCLRSVVLVMCLQFSDLGYTSSPLSPVPIHLTCCQPLNQWYCMFIKHTLA